MNILLFFYDYLSKYRLGMKNHFSPSIIYHIGPIEKKQAETLFQLIYCERKILFRLKQQAEKDEL